MCLSRNLLVPDHVNTTGYEAYNSKVYYNQALFKHLPKSDYEN
jgi:hypothetical protein